MTVIEGDGSSVGLEWESDVMNDMVADSVLSVVLQVESNPTSVKRMLAMLSITH